MKTDMNSLKKELSRLADVDYLKKELARITAEVKKIDVHISLTPQAHQRVARLEKRGREVVKSLAKLQKQFDAGLAKFMKAVRARKGSVSKAAPKRTSAKKASKKSATTRKAARTTRKSTSK